MDEENNTNPPRKYIWPRYVLAAVVLGIVLGIIWMSVLVRRIRNQREFLQWPTNAQPVMPLTNPAPQEAAPESTKRESQRQQ